MILLSSKISLVMTEENPIDFSRDRISLRGLYLISQVILWISIVIFDSLPYDLPLLLWHIMKQSGEIYSFIFHSKIEHFESYTPCTLKAVFLILGTEVMYVLIKLVSLKLLTKNRLLGKLNICPCRKQWTEHWNMFFKCWYYFKMFFNKFLFACLIIDHGWLLSIKNIITCVFNLV